MYPVSHVPCLMYLFCFSAAPLFLLFGVFRLGSLFILTNDQQQYPPAVTTEHETALKQKKLHQEVKHLDGYR